MTRFPWRQDRDLAGIAIGELDLLSIDVFDTLVSRTCGDPSAVFERLETFGRADGVITDALPQGAFPRLRAQLEKDARAACQAAKGHSEVGLGDIYGRLPRHFGNPEALVVLEVETERGLLVANPYLLDLMDACRVAGPRVWLVSDTTYDEATLVGLLASCGIEPSRYDRLVASSARSCSKADGRLFDLVRAEAGLRDGSRWVHIGDNPASDVTMAASRGVQPIHYQVPPALRRVEQRERLTGSTAPGALGAYRRLIARTTATGHDPDGFWFDLGRHVIGPAVHAYCASVLRSCMGSGVRRIAPFMREGAVFADIIRREADRIGFDGDIRPLSISREALRLPLSAGLDTDALVRMASNSSRLTLGDAIQPYSLLDILPARLRSRCAEPLTNLLAEAGFKDEIGRVLAGEAVRVGIAARIATSRIAAEAYLRQALGDGPTVATVDLGARGTTQSLLGRLFPAGSPYVFHHHLLYAVPDLFRNLADGHHWHVFAGLDEAVLSKASIVYRSPQLIELALIGDLPTTAGYRMGDEGAVPVFQPAAGGPEQARKLRACRLGILHASEFLTDLARIQPIVDQTPIPATAAFDSLFRLVQAPLAAEARESADLRYDWNDGVRSAQALVDDAALAELSKLDRLDVAARPKLALSLRPGILPWPQAALTMRDEDAMVRVCEANRASLDHHSYVRLLLELVKSEPTGQAILCGAGGLAGMAPTFLEMAASTDLSVVGYFDYFQESASTSFTGIPTLTAAELAGQSCDTFIIVSMGYAEALASIVERCLGAAGRSGRIIMLPLHTR